MEHDDSRLKLLNLHPNIRDILSAHKNLSFPLKSIPRIKGELELIFIDPFLM